MMTARVFRLFCHTTRFHPWKEIHQNAHSHYYLTSFPPCAKAPKAAVKICKNAKRLQVLGSSVTCSLASISNDIPRDLARSICAWLGLVLFCSLVSISTLESLGDEDEDPRCVGSGDGGAGADSSDRTVNVTSSCSSSGSFVSLESEVQTNTVEPVNTDTKLRGPNYCYCRKQRKQNIKIS